MFPRTAVFLLLAFVAAAQSEFEVASIRPHPGEINYSSNFLTGGMYRGVAITLNDLILDAYGLQRYQVVNTPGWASSERFDVEGRAGSEGALKWERARPMLQALLAGRFKLKVHRENREVPAYDLVIAKGGPKFKENNDPKVEHPGAVTYGDASGMHVKATKAPLSRLLPQLSINLDSRPVIDKTGLAGNYDYTLNWTRDNTPAAAEGNIPGVFTAIQEQLGLKLEPSKTTVEVVVVDSVDKPTSD